MILRRLCQSCPILLATSKLWLDSENNLFDYRYILMIYLAPIYSQLMTKVLLANNSNQTIFYWILNCLVIIISWYSVSLLWHTIVTPLTKHKNYHDNQLCWYLLLNKLLVLLYLMASQYSCPLIIPEIDLDFYL